MIHPLLIFDDSNKPAMDYPAPKWCWSPIATLSKMDMHFCPFNLCNFFQKGLAKNKIRDEVFQNGFWILPSSIHEVILLEKKNLYQADELQRMVIEINGSIVKPNEKLSDSVYYFDENLVKVDRREELIRDVV